MKFVKCLLVGVFVFGLGACSSDPDDESTGRTTRRTVATDDPASGGTGSDSGVLIVELSASTQSAIVGQSVTVTAQGWLDSAKTEPVTAGTSISLSLTGVGVLAVGQATAGADGKAATTLTSSSAGQATITATIGSVDSASLVVGFAAAARQVGTVSINVTKTAVTVNDDEPANLGDEALVYVTVADQLGIALANTAVTLAATDGSLSTNVGVTDNNGTVGPITFSGGIKAGEVVLTASAGGKQGTAKITVGPGAPVIIDVAEPSPKQIGIRGSGNETSLVLFTIKDRYGNPVSDNTVVTFKLEPVLKGASVSPVTTTTHGGMVSPTVNAGTMSGALQLAATVPNVGRSVISGKISIFGGKPTSIQLVSDRSIFSGFEYSGLEANLTVWVLDMHGNPVAPGTSVYTMCEAGRCGSNDGVGILTNDAGSATFKFSSTMQEKVWNSGVSMVEDFGGFVGTNHTWSLWEPLGSPADGLVNVVALTTGQTDFADDNGNGIWDVGELLYDTPPDDRRMPEPFLDINSNQVWDNNPFEAFRDFDGNNAWTDKPTTYQGTQYIWDSKEILWTRIPAVHIVGQQFIDMNGDGVFDVDWDLIAVGGPITSTTELLTRFPWFPMTATITTGYASFSTSASIVSVAFHDMNGNPLPKGSTMTAEILGDTLELNSPPAGALTYGAEYNSAKRPIDFILRDKDRGIEDDEYFSFCATVSVGDTSDSFTRCMGGISF